jgi:hypothetical protein
MRVCRLPFCELIPALTATSFDMLRSVVFFYIKSPLRVEEAGLHELIPTTWWPHRSSREVGRLLVGWELAVRAGTGFLSHLAHSI